MTNDGDNPFEGTTAPLEKKPAVKMAASNVRLVVVDGIDKGRSLVIDASSPPRITIGSSPHCELGLGDRLVSRRHAAVDLRDHFLELTDLDSKNGTQVNGVAVLAARLSGGEIIRLGATSIRVEVTEAASPLVDRRDSFGPLVGASTAMRRVYRVLDKLASSDVAVLIEGERGTGKSTTATALHEASTRSNGPLVTIACEQLEDGRAELEAAFGSAARGTLVLEEVAALDDAAQRALLALASSSSAARVISTTRRNLDREVEMHRFREDLLLRLDVGRVELPPLRFREGDVPVLALHLWKRLGGEAAALPHEMLARAGNEWPGNVRELERLLARRLALGDEPSSQRGSGELGADFAEEILAQLPPLIVARERLVAEFDRRYLARMLAAHGGNVTRASEAAGIARRYFQILRAKRT
jgi:DNA-binding NtrC family response regulator